MKTNSITLAILVLGSLLLTGCSSTASRSTIADDQMTMDTGNSGNVKVISNRTMMFHDVLVTRTTDGAELDGKIHARGHKDYLPGHIDIAVIDRETGDTKLVVTTDFNSRIARHGRYNLRHPNNISTRLPGIHPDRSTIVIAYHYSNVDRFSKIDCGANVALAAVDDRK